MIRSSSSEQLLQIWDTVAGEPPARRNTKLLACMIRDSASVDGMTIGERDRMLLDLRRQLVSDDVECVTACPECQTSVEFSFLISDILPSGDTPAISHTLVHEDYEVAWKIPTCADVGNLANRSSGIDARTRLLDSCLLSVRHKGDEIKSSGCPDAIVEQVLREMREADPMGDIQFDLGCPDCDCRWISNFDIGSYLWNEIDAWANMLLRDVHRLASRYGWSEGEILRMSNRRRNMYLNMVGT